MLGHWIIPNRAPDCRLSGYGIFRIFPNSIVYREFGNYFAYPTSHNIVSCIKYQWANHGRFASVFTPNMVFHGLVFRFLLVYFIPAVICIICYRFVLLTPHILYKFIYNFGSSASFLEIHLFVLFMFGQIKSEIYIHSPLRLM